MTRSGYLMVLSRRGRKVVVAFLVALLTAVTISSVQTLPSANATEDTEAVSRATQKLGLTLQNLEDATSVIATDPNSTIVQAAPLPLPVNYRTPSAGMSAAQLQQLNADNVKEYEAKVEAAVSEMDSQKRFISDLPEPDALGQAKHVDLGTLTGRCWDGTHAYADISYEIDHDSAYITGVSNAYVDVDHNPWPPSKSCERGQFDTSVISTDQHLAGDFYSHPRSGKRFPVPFDAEQGLLSHVLQSVSTLFAIWHRNDSHDDPSLYGVSLNKQGSYWTVPVRSDMGHTDKKYSPSGHAVASVTTVNHVVRLYNTQYFNSTPDGIDCFFASANTEDNPGFNCKPTTPKYETTTQSVDLDLPAQTLSVTYWPPSVQAPTLYGALQVGGSSSPVSVDTAGRVISYSFVVSNVGDSDVSGITAKPATPGLSAVTCPATTLGAGQSMTCTAQYTVTQADIDSGTLSKAVTVSGADQNKYSLTERATVSTQIAQRSELALSGSVSASTISWAGDRLDYTLQAKNAGNVTLKRVSLLLDKFSGSGTAPEFDGVQCVVTGADGHRLPGVQENGQIVLSPGESASCSAKYTVTQADVDAGSVTSSGIARAEDPQQRSVSPSSAVEIAVEAVQKPDLGLSMSASAKRFNRPGKKLDYTLRAKNAGNVTLRRVGLLLDKFSGSGTVPEFGGVQCVVTDTDGQQLPDTQENGQIVLAPGQSASCAANYVTTQADVDAGAVTSSGIARAEDPQQRSVSPSILAEATVEAVQKPDLGLSMSASAKQFDQPGKQLTYTLKARNAGNVTLKQMDLARTNFSGTGKALDFKNVQCVVRRAEGSSQPLSQDNGHIILAPGESVSCQASYVTTQSDLDAGLVASTGTATARDPQDKLVKPRQSVKATVKASQKPRLTIAQTSDKDGRLLTDKDSVRYTAHAVNQGNTTLKAVKVAVADFTGNGRVPSLAGQSCVVRRVSGDSRPLDQPNGQIVLAPSESVTCVTDPYKVTAVDTTRGKLVSSMASTATTSQGKPVAGLAVEAQTEKPTGGTLAIDEIELVPETGPLADTGDSVLAGGLTFLVLLAGGLACCLLSRRKSS